MKKTAAGLLVFDVGYFAYNGLVGYSKLSFTIIIRSGDNKLPDLK